ncbi:MAG: hypothetical protein Q9167_000322 [Letrouitia subvulpina]
MTGLESLSRELKIDPLHRSRPTNVNLDSSNPTASYFRIDLERWKDLNLSESFSGFVSQVIPFCDSLPQLVHFQREIATHLMTAIEKRDPLSLEPLLSLLASFARDLGVEFEKYFSDFVKLVTSLAASHHHAEVIEWSFTCLAWLFKYLSRLLIPNLRPLFHIMAPLLGKTPQKSHIVRFAAESMSFLVRKAAHGHRKNNDPLSTIIDCIWEDVCNTSEHVWNMEVYRHGLMTLLLGAIKGVGTNLPSTGTMVYGSLLKRLNFLTCPVGNVKNIIEGITIALIHHTDQVTFRPIADMIIDHIESGFQGMSMRSKNSESNDHCPERIQSPRLGHNPSRAASSFGAFKFIDVAWKTLQIPICHSLPLLLGDGKKLPCPELWQKEILNTFEAANRQDGDDLIDTCHMYLKALRYLSLESSVECQVMSLLRQMIESVLPTSNRPNKRTRFLFGEAFKAYARFAPIGSDMSKIWLPLYSAAAQYRTVVPYLKGVFSSIDSLDVGEHQNRLDSLMDSLIKNLRTPSNTLRLLSLDILGKIIMKTEHHSSEILATALALENCPLDLKGARLASMYVRRMSVQYSTEMHPWLEKALSSFCFGIMTFKLAQLWDDVIEVLKVICGTPRGEELVSSLAFEWLEAPAPIQSLDESKLQPTERQVLTEFQCSNLIRTEGTLTKVEREFNDIENKPWHRFESDHEEQSPSVSEAQKKALRVFIGIPWLAEKQSRRLVPLFLQWTAHETREGVTNLSSQLPQVVELPLLNTRDRKSMLHLFGLFLNPRALYQSLDVFEALKGQIASGDVEVQRAALKAILTWKTPVIEQYQENLMNLLDDNKYREELSTFAIFNGENDTKQRQRQESLLPIILRLLYGKMIAGGGSGKKAQIVKRKAVLEALAQVTPAGFHELLVVVLGPLSGLQIVTRDGTLTNAILDDLISARKQVGSLNMVRDMLEILHNKLEASAENLISAVLYCMIRANSRLNDPPKDIWDTTSGYSEISLFKDIRHIGMQCLNLLFHHYSAPLLRPYVSAILEVVINPRLERLPIETAQSVSGVLQLFSTWASEPDKASFLIYQGSEIMKSIIKCLGVASAKNEVKMFVLDEILHKLAQQSQQTLCSGSTQTNDLDHSNFQQQLEPTLDSLLAQLKSLFAESSNTDLLGSATELLLQLAPMIHDSTQQENVLEVSLFLLEQPPHRISPKVKSRYLCVVRQFLSQHPLSLSSNLSDRLYFTTCSLFGYFNDRENRLSLTQIFRALAETDSSLHEVAELCASLNSFSANRLDEPNFGERLQAFNSINEQQFETLTVKQWRPLVFNMLFYVQETEEMAIRSSASLSLRRFIETNTISSTNGEPSSFNLLQEVLLPAIRNGVSNSSELIRIEYLAIMAHLVRLNPEWDEIRDMLPLLVGDDAEASFFNNILHIQQHRRLRALRRLSAEARQGHIKSTNIARFFLPLVEHFVFEKAEDDNAHNVRAETLLTIGALVPGLEWRQFRAVFGRYLGYIQSKPDHTKTTIRLFGNVVDSLSQATEAKQSSGMGDLAQATQGSATEQMSSSALSLTIPSFEKFTKDILVNILPSLTKYLHQKEESTVSLRIPVAVSSAKLLKLLSSDQIQDQLPPILTDVCHILRSRAQESRDMTRKTLVDMLTIIGPNYLGFVLKELRHALARGYQLHVLSYTVHSILVAAVPIFGLGSLDYCLPQIVSIIMDDIFGATGHEKDAEDYISKMKEVKSSKSFDSMELVAKVASAENFSLLIQPLQMLLQQKLDLRTIQKADELLRRIGVGLICNEAAQSRKVLIFCHEIIREAYEMSRGINDTAVNPDHRTKRFLINFGGASKSGVGTSTSSYNYKFIRFGLDVLRSVLHKHDMLRTQANLAGFMPIIGDALIDPNEEIQISVLRLLTTIIQVPSPQIDEHSGIYIAESVKIIKISGSMNAEIAQAALKLVSSILRNRKNVEFRETDVAYLLKRLMPELEEPDRQGAAFNFLKAVMARKIIITEVYEVTDVVATMMVTNQSRGARDLARGVYFQFLMDYPQNQKRFEKQMAFLVNNLEYKHQEGRQSVMEVINLLLLKTGESLLQTVVDHFFRPLILIIANDESTSCREIASTLLKACFQQADDERIKSFLALLKSWLGKRDQPLLYRVALQAYGTFFESRGTSGEKTIAYLKPELEHAIEKCISDSVDSKWEILYSALQTFSKICHIFPSLVLGSDYAKLWASVRQCLSFPHAWVKLLSAKLLELFLTDVMKANARQEQIVLPLKGLNGLSFDGREVMKATKASLGCLKVPCIPEDLASQCARNLVLLGRIMGRSSLRWEFTDQIAKAGASHDDRDEDESQSSEVLQGLAPRTGLDFILQQASEIVRCGPLTKNVWALLPLNAALQVIRALCNNLPAPAIAASIETILLSLHNLTDPSITAPFSSDEEFSSAYKSIVSDASDIMNLLQQKLGTTAYVSKMSKVREGVKARREDRRVKRRIEAVTEPEKVGKLKKRKVEKKKEKRKEKSAGHRSVRRGW